MSAVFYKLDFLGSNNKVIGLFVVAAEKLLNSKGIIMDFPATLDAACTQFIPIVFCESYERLRNDGVNCPREFVIERSDFYYREVEGQPVSGFSVLKRRLLYLCDSFYELAIDGNVLKDWFAGLFRKYCFQDESVHGSSCLLDLSSRDAVATCKEWLGNSTGVRDDVKCFWHRFDCVPKDSGGKVLEGCENPNVDSLEIYNEIIKGIFSCEYMDIRCEICSYRDAPNQASSETYCLGRLDAIKKKLPYGNGSAIKFTSPTLKFKILVIDDNAKDECDTRLRKNDVAHGIFEFEELELKGDGILKQAEERFKDPTEAWKTYDFALLDLSLGEEPGSDLYGYQLIQLLHQFFPQMPVIVYSQFSDMGHIARAFRYGAKWFLKKDEAYKLLRHAISILSLRDWRKEWNTVNRLGLCGKIDVRGPKDFTDEQKYLTYRCMERLPGKDIFVKVMGDGFSSAVTFRARKWSEDKNGTRVYFQDPVIIKIDTAFNTMTEFERYFRFIRPYIANESGRVESKEITLDHNNSAITYTFAGKNDNSRALDTMKNMMAEDARYMARCDYKKYESVFDEIFDDILPKIHRVSPKNPNLESPISSYPNRIFGEKDTDGTGFIDNYLARIPLSRHFDVKKFADTDTDRSLPFEMHGVATEGEEKVIEAYALRPDYSKLNVILTGDVVDHVARYRELRQGQTLWVDGDYVNEKKKNDNNQAVSKPEMDRVILGRLIEILYSKDSKNRDENGNPTFYDGEKDQPFDLNRSDGTKKEQSRNTFCKLVKTLILGHKPDDGKDLTDLLFDSIVYDMYKATCDLCTASSANDRFKCKVGIVHGDLNYANIMVDSKKDGTIDDAKDVWLIDFARTRRDIIAHDFNVIFTATFSQLFNNDLWNDKGIDSDNTTRYAARLTKIFPRFIRDAMFAESDEEPDYLYVMKDRRFTLFYKIFRRIRKAALSNDNMTEDMYALTTALCCLYTFKVFLKYEKNIQGAAALLATAYICIEHLKPTKP